MSYVSVDEALSLPAVYRAVTTISTTVSQLDMAVVRNGVEIDSALVARPDSNRSQSSFFKRTVHDLVTTGNAYWRLWRNSDGAVVNMEVLSPSRVLIRFDDNNTKFYEYTQDNGQRVTLTNNLPTTNGGQVEHIRLNEFDGYVEGRGPIQTCNKAIASILVQRDYYERFLTDSKRPSGIYTVKSGEPDAEDLAQIKSQIVANRTTGAPDVLPGDIDYKTVMFTAEESGLIEMNKAAVQDVARIFGLPAHLLLAAVEGSSMTYQNLQTADLVFVRSTIEQYLTAIEDAMTNVLPRGQVAKFNTDNWIRAAAVLVNNTTQKEAAPADPQAA